MPTTIYDASLVTQRSRDKVIAQQIRQATIAGNPIIIPQAGYSSYLLGEVNNGNITYFRKVDGCTDINLSCNCTGSTTITESAAPAPGPSGSYTVTYFGNTNTSGAVPIDGSSPYSPGSTVTILGNSGVLAKTSNFFAGWNTAADGSGTAYVGGNTFTINQNTSLFAQWIPTANGAARLVYNSNSAEGGAGTAPSSSGTYYTPFSSAGVVGSTFTNSNGYLFGGWNTVQNGSGTAYPPGSIYTLPETGTVTLFAQWINPATTYTLEYLPGTDGSGTAPAPVTTYSSDAPATILGNTGPFTNSDPNKIFYRWNTAADGSGISYQAGATITMNANKTLYAQWATSTPTFTLTYEANGATGGTPPTDTYSPYPSGVQSTPILGRNTLVRTGFQFLGWNSATNGTGTNYIISGTTLMTSNKILYAQWVGGVVVKDCGEASGGTNLAISIGALFDKKMYRDNTNNTITVILPTQYNNTVGTVYGNGTGPIDSTHTGNIVDSYGRVELSEAAGVYSINITYSTNWTGQNQLQTGSIVLSPTYWPTSQTISTITISNSPANFAFSTSPSPDGTVTVISGCFTSISSVTSGTSTTTSSSIISFYITFSDGTTTRVAIGTQNRWVGTLATSPYTLVYNRTRVELANGPTPVPITGTFTPTATAAVNST